MFKVCGIIGISKLEFQFFIDFIERVKKLGNFKRIPEILGSNGQVLSQPPERNIFTFALQKFAKSAIQHSIEKPMLFNFADLSAIFCPRLYFWTKYFIGSFRLYKLSSCCEMCGWKTYCLRRFATTEILKGVILSFALLLFWKKNCVLLLLAFFISNIIVSSFSSNSISRSKPWDSLVFV